MALEKQPLLQVRIRRRSALSSLLSDNLWEELQSQPPEKMDIMKHCAQNKSFSWLLDKITSKTGLSERFGALPSKKEISESSCSIDGVSNPDGAHGYDTGGQPGLIRPESIRNIIQDQLKAYNNMGRPQRKQMTSTASTFSSKHSLEAIPKVAEARTYREYRTAMAVMESEKQSEKKHTERKDFSKKTGKKLTPHEHPARKSRHHSIRHKRHSKSPGRSFPEQAEQRLPQKRQLDGDLIPTSVTSVQGSPAKYDKKNNTGSSHFHQKVDPNGSQTINKDGGDFGAKKRKEGSKSHPARKKPLLCKTLIADVFCQSAEEQLTNNHTDNVSFLPGEVLKENFHSTENSTSPNTHQSTSNCISSIPAGELCSQHEENLGHLPLQSCDVELGLGETGSDSRGEKFPERISVTQSEVAAPAATTVQVKEQLMTESADECVTDSDTCKGASDQHDQGDVNGAEVKSSELTCRKADDEGTDMPLQSPIACIVQDQQAENVSTDTEAVVGVTSVVADDKKLLSSVAEVGQEHSSMADRGSSSDSLPAVPGTSPDISNSQVVEIGDTESSAFQTALTLVSDQLKMVVDNEPHDSTGTQGLKLESNNVSEFQASQIPVIESVSVQRQRRPHKSTGPSQMNFGPQFQSSTGNQQPHPYQRNFARCQPLPWQQQPMIGFAPQYPPPELAWSTTPPTPLQSAPPWSVSKPSQCSTSGIEPEPNISTGVPAEYIPGEKKSDMAPPPLPPEEPATAPPPLPPDTSTGSENKNILSQLLSGIQGSITQPLDNPLVCAVQSLSTSCEPTSCGTAKEFPRLQQSPVDMELETPENSPSRVKTPVKDVPVSTVSKSMVSATDACQRKNVMEISLHTAKPAKRLGEDQDVSTITAKNLPISSSSSASENTKGATESKVKDTVSGQVPKNKRRTRPETAGKFHGRTLLMGAGVPYRLIPPEPLYLTHPIRKNGMPEEIPEDPRPVFYALRSITAGKKDETLVLPPNRKWCDVKENDPNSRTGEAALHTSCISGEKKYNRRFFHAELEEAATAPHLQSRAETDAAKNDLQMNLTGSVRTAKKVGIVKGVLKDQQNEQDRPIKMDLVEDIFREGTGRSPAKSSPSMSLPYDVTDDVSRPFRLPGEAAVARVSPLLSVSPCSSKSYESNKLPCLESRENKSESPSSTSDISTVSGKYVAARGRSPTRTSMPFRQCYADMPYSVHHKGTRGHSKERRPRASSSSMDDVMSRDVSEMPRRHHKQSTSKNFSVSSPAFSGASADLEPYRPANLDDQSEHFKPRSSRSWLSSGEICRRSESVHQLGDYPDSRKVQNTDYHRTRWMSGPVNENPQHSDSTEARIRRSRSQSRCRSRGSSPENSPSHSPLYSRSRGECYTREGWSTSLYNRDKGIARYQGTRKRNRDWFD